MRKELSSKNEPALDDLGNSQPVQNAKDANIRRFMCGKACMGEKATDVAEEIKCVTRGCTQPPTSAESRNGMGLPRKDLWTLFFDGVHPHDKQETHKVFENVISAETLLA